MVVKENHPLLRATLELLLDSPVSTRVPRQRVVTRECGHALRRRPPLGGPRPHWPPRDFQIALRPEAPQQDR
jgi:hypothetical protein